MHEILFESILQLKLTSYSQQRYELGTIINFTVAVEETMVSQEAANLKCKPRQLCPLRMPPTLQHSASGAWIMRPSGI